MSRRISNRRRVQGSSPSSRGIRRGRSQVLRRKVFSIMADGVRLHRWDEIALEKVTEVISRKIVTGEREMLSQVYRKRGALEPMHKHESEQLTYVMQGALRFLVGGEEAVVREGEVLVIP